MSLIRRKKQKLIIAPRNTELFVQTVLYKANPHAFRNLVMILVLLVIAFISMTALTMTGAIILILLVVAIPVTLSFVGGKKWFSFNAVYDEPLVFEPNALQVGDEYFSIRDLENVVFYIHSFYGFRYHLSHLPPEHKMYVDKTSRIVSGNYRSEYGDKNEIHFEVNGKKYECRFLLGSGTAWYALYHIMQAWKMQGKEVMLKEEFSYDFVEREIAIYAGSE